MQAQCEDGPSPRKTADRWGDVTPEAGGGHHVLPAELPGSVIRGFSGKVALESSSKVIYLKPKLPERSQYRPHTEFQPLEAEILQTVGEKYKMLMSQKCQA